MQIQALNPRPRRGSLGPPVRLPFTVCRRSTRSPLHLAVLVAHPRALDSVSSLESLQDALPRSDRFRIREGSVRVRKRNRRRGSACLPGPCRDRGRKVSPLATARDAAIAPATASALFLGTIKASPFARQGRPAGLCHHATAPTVSSTSSSPYTRLAQVGASWPCSHRTPCPLPSYQSSSTFPSRHERTPAMFCSRQNALVPERGGEAPREAFRSGDLELPGRPAPITGARAPVSAIASESCRPGARSPRFARGSADLERSGTGAAVKLYSTRFSSPRAIRAEQRTLRGGQRQHEGNVAFGSGANQPCVPRANLGDGDRGSCL